MAQSQVCQLALGWLSLGQGLPGAVTLLTGLAWTQLVGGK